MSTLEQLTVNVAERGHAVARVTAQAWGLPPLDAARLRSRVHQTPVYRQPREYLRQSHEAAASGLCRQRSLGFSFAF